MGRKNKSYHKDLKQQIYEKFTTMLKNGEGRNKTADKKNNNTQNFIYSYNTYKSYWKHAKYFANYINEYYSECTTLKSARKYVNEWLQFRIDHGGQNDKTLSAWTIALERQALGKLFSIDPDSTDFFKTPVRKREDIVRSRTATKRDKHFSEAEIELIKKRMALSGAGLVFSHVHSAFDEHYYRSIYDRRAMLYASKQLGHNRIDVIANSYLHNL